jgi:hypothetical protein
MTIRLTELNSETEWDPFALRANRSRGIKYRPLLPKHNWLFFVIPDLSLPFFAANCQAVSELSSEFEHKRLLLISRLVFGL